MSPQTVRCKFSCNSVAKRLFYSAGAQGFLYTYEFTAVYNESPENERFFASSPSGSLKVGAYDEDLFEPGKEYYIDITLAVPVA